jgi:hypothetical protein
MLNAASQPTASTLQPFRLLDLPRELLIPVVRSYRSPITDYGRGDGLFIYAGEQDVERYDILRRLCLTHRDILPFAQEELSKRLDIESDERRDLLNRSIESSERCKGYAGRAESIFLGEDVDPDGLTQIPAFNPREVCIMSTLNISLLSRSYLNHGIPVALNLMLSTDRFQNLRQVHVCNPTYDEASVLPNLETYSVSSNDLSNIHNASADFEPVNLPNLRRLSIYDSRRPKAHDGTGIASFGSFYDSVIPQLDHLHLFSPDFTDLEHLLLLSTSLQSSRVKSDDFYSSSSKLFILLLRVDTKALHFTQNFWLQASDTWERKCESVKEMKVVLERNDHIKQVELTYVFHYLRASSNVCAQSL